MPTPLVIYEAFPSRETDLGENPGITLSYVIQNSGDELFVSALLDTMSPATYGILYKQRLHVEETAPGIWRGTVTYGARKKPEAGDYQISFDTTGGTQHITQAVAERGIHVPAGATAPTFNGAIGVTDDGVEGVDIIVPALEWTETWQIPAAAVTWTYIQTLKDMTGALNSATFRGQPAGEVLFKGASGSRSSRSPDFFEIAYKFGSSATKTNLQIDAITVPTKKGWDYLWIRYKTQEDTNAKCLVRKPLAAVVDIVYFETDFAALGIGTGT